MFYPQSNRKADRFRSAPRKAKNQAGCSSEGSAKENSMRSSFSFRWNREPGTYNCRLKKRTGLGPHPTLEKPQFWPLFRSMSGVLKLLILGISRTEKNSKNSAPTGTCPSTPLYVQVTT